MQVVKCSVGRVSYRLSRFVFVSLDEEEANCFFFVLVISGQKVTFTLRQSFLQKKTRLGFGSM